MGAGVGGLQDDEVGRWPARRLAALGVQVSALVLPLAAALAASLAASRALPEPRSWIGRTCWWAGLLVLSTVVLVVVDRQGRRLLPLAVLLKLSLVFPDHAPPRFGVALRAGTASQLRRRLEEAKAGGSPGETMCQAAGRLLELVAALAVHDRETRGHCERVRAYAGMIGQEMGLSADERDKLNWGALLHDIGKIALPSALLNKKGPLTTAELDLVRQHPGTGAVAIGPIAQWLGPWATPVHQHHERWDGAGYPCGLRGEEIALAARIVAVADVFDVMTGLRSYKRPVSAALARRELAACAGKQFDPAVVRAMLSVSLGQMWPAMGPLTWLAQLPLLRGTAPVAVPATITTAARALVVAGAVQSLGPVMSPPAYPAAPVDVAATLVHRHVPSALAQWRSTSAGPVQTAPPTTLGGFPATTGPREQVAPRAQSHETGRLGAPPPWLGDTGVASTAAPDGHATFVVGGPTTSVAGQTTSSVSNRARTPATGASPLGVRRGEVRIPRHSSAVSNQVGTPGPLQAVAVGGPASTSAVPSTTVVVLPPPPLPPTTSTPPPTTAAAVLPSTTAALTVSTTAPLVAVAANVSPGTGVAGAGASTSVSPVTMTHPPLTVVPPTAPPVTVLEVTVPPPDVPKAQNVPEVVVSVPRLSTPGVTVPTAAPVTIPQVTVTVPQVTVPQVTVTAPPVRVPEVTVPAVPVTVPQVTVPPATVPQVAVIVPRVTVTAPPVTVTVPPATVAQVTVTPPPLSVPELTTPTAPVMVPQVTVPPATVHQVAVTAPPVSVPEVTVALPVGLVPTTTVPGTTAVATTTTAAPVTVATVPGPPVPTP